MHRMDGRTIVCSVALLALVCAPRAAVAAGAQSGSKDEAAVRQTVKKY